MTASPASFIEIGPSVQVAPPGVFALAPVWIANTPGGATWTLGPMLMKLTGNLPLTRDYLPCKFHWDWTKHSGNYPWVVCHGPCMMDSITLSTIPRTCIHLRSLWHTSPHPVAGPLWVSSRSAPVQFSGEFSPGALEQGLLRMVPHPWLAALRCDLAHFLTCDCSLGDGAIHLPYLGEVSPTLGKVPCEFHWDCPIPSSRYW